MNEKVRGEGDGQSEKIPWLKIQKRLSEIDWGKIFEGMNAEECTYIFIEIIKIICLDLIPLRNKTNKSKIPRERKTLLNGIKMLKSSSTGHGTFSCKQIFFI